VRLMRSSPPFPPPSSATSRTGRPTHGAAVAATARQLGYDLLGWQRRVCDVGLEHVDSQLSYRTVTVSTPRQQGKSSLLLALLCWRMLSADGQRLVYMAQNRLSARSKLLDSWAPRISKSALGSRFRVTRGMGTESLRSSNGSILTILSGEESSGHGDVCDCVLLDECWSLDSRAEQSTRPSTMTRRNAQTWMASTAGSEKSVWWRSKIEQGRAAAADGVTAGTAHLEWSADPAADPADPATWAACMPALGATVQLETVEADFASMTPSEFRRGFLNLWPDQLGDGWSVIPQSVWEAAQL
jgi:phage terminase large subunit-like protein